jgi:hypothetical protein
MGMLVLLVFAFFVNVFGKQNFQVQGNGINSTQALSQCFAANLCTSETGCCNGHGVCTANETTQYCECSTPQECRSGLSPLPTYTGATCDAVSIDPGCCKDGSDDLIFAQSGVCVKRDGTDAESGAKGRLLKRLDAASYNDSIGSTVDPDSQIYSWQHDLLTSGTVHLTQFNMMTLGFLQVALKDAVHLDYYNVADQNVTFNGTTYPKVRHQDNTGVTGSPKSFEDTATAIADVGPLYDYATKVGGSGPYIDVTPAVNYWSNTHHMTNEFIVAVKFLGLYHNYVAGNVEDFFCGAHSTNTSNHGNTCTITVAEQYNLARRSTIRFWHNLLQSAVLYIGVENESHLEAFDESYFYTWWWRDSTTSPNGGGCQEVYDKIRTGAEFSDGITYSQLNHHLISALDFFISARNPNTNTTAYAAFGSSSPCGFNPANIVYPGGQTPAAIVQDVFNLFHTKTQRWGSKIHSAYAAETALLLYRAQNELGLSSYKNTISYLKDNITASDITTHENVFYGVHKDASASRKYLNTTAFVALAANIVPLNDVILVDRTGYFAVDQDGYWTSRQFHPDPSLISSPDYEFANCYKGGGGSCTNTALRGAGVLTSQILESLSPEFSSGNTAWFTRGALNAGPIDWVPPHAWDQWSKENAGFPVLTEIINPLFYQFNGAASMAFKFCDSLDYFLPNVITDAFPSAIGWSGYLDGQCWQSNLIADGCPRSRTAMGTPDCECFYFPE